MGLSNGVYLLLDIWFLAIDEVEAVHFLLALQFLTILPIKIKSEIESEDFGKSLLYFPIVGMLIGVLLSLSALILNQLGNFVMAALVLIISIIITGGIHLDGFADFCDGFYAGRSKEQILEIMRDSRIGVMAAVGIVCILLLKFALISTIPQANLFRSLVMMTTFSRWSQGLACYISGYSQEARKAKFFIEYVSPKEAIIGGLFTVIIFWLLGGLINGSVLFILTSLFILLFASYVKKKISGMTGDTIGAASELAEVLILLFTFYFWRR